jgi:hypothetical protein
VILKTWELPLWEILRPDMSSGLLLSLPSRCVITFAPAGTANENVMVATATATSTTKDLRTGVPPRVVDGGRYQPERFSYLHDAVEREDAHGEDAFA